MKFFSVKTGFTLVAALILGVVLHFLFQWFPHILTALISPVRESLWEHLKILLLPLALSGLYLSRGKGLDGLAPWILTLPIVGCLMLLAGYLYHITFHGQGMTFDLILYGILMVVGFVLPQVLFPFTQLPGMRTTCLILALAIIWLLVWFTFFPPHIPLFQDLSRVQPSFYLLPKN